MTPAEAAALLIEPDWAEEFKDRGADEFVFETLLLKWREWHAMPLEDGRKKLGSSVAGMIALAQLGVMPPRNVTDRPPGLFEEQHDDQCWFVSEGRAWRIVGIEDRMLFLNSFGEEKQIDLSRAKWDKYCEHHAAVLEALRVSH